MSTKKPPSIPQKSGLFAKQAHVDIPPQTFEEEHGRSGFFGHVSHLYHQNPPTGWSRIEGSLLPRAYDLSLGIEKNFNSNLPEPLLSNADVTIGVYYPQKTMPFFYRNADADELYFIHNGCGTIETDYGPIHYVKGDYLLIPRGTTYRFYPKLDPQINHFYLHIESATEFEIPDRGQLGRHAFYDPGVLEIPQASISKADPTDGNEWRVLIKRESEHTSVFYPFNPLDTVGWKGDLHPWRLNIKDIRPIISPRYHLPPSVHSTVIARGFVVCTFAPRPMETGDPKAMRVPFFHRNIDYDEVIFYHDGDFFSRTNIKPGMVTFHPQGIHHGPHPKALENQFTKKFTDEYAVMIDTLRPLKPVGLATQTEITSYKDSWKK